MTTPPAIDKQNTTKYGAAGRPILRMGSAKTISPVVPECLVTEQR